MERKKKTNQISCDLNSTSLIKKIVCLVLVISMLISNFIPTIKVLAAESQNFSNTNLTSGNSNATNEGSNGSRAKLAKAPNDNFEVKTKNDQHEIRTFGMEFVSGAQLDENNNLVWTAGSSAKGHEFTFRVNYALSGLYEFPAESITMKIPKSILRNRDKELDDKFIMSLPTQREYNGNTELAYIEDDENLIIYNPREVPAGLNGYFEITYATASKTFEYRDYDPNNTGLITDGGTASDPFYATIEVKSGTDTLRNITNKENVYINTTACIESTKKIYPDIYREWQNGWTAETPADADDYYYLVWTIRTSIFEPTQPYNFSIEDVIQDETEGLNGEDYEIVGYKLSGERFFTDKTKAYNQRIAGYRYDYVLTRHKKSTYTGLKYQLKNSETATVDPIDQVDEDTSASSSNIFFWDPHFEPPIGSFDLYKYGNNSGFNGTYSSYELDKFQRKEIDTLGGFKYKTEVSGYQYLWTVRDEDSIAYPESYGKVNVNYETWDDTLYLEEDTRPLSTEDYYLSSLGFDLACTDATYNDFEMKFEPKDINNFKNDEIITFYAKFNGSQEWIQVAQYNYKNGSKTLNNDYVSSLTYKSINFKPDVHATGWKYTTSSNHYYVNIVAVPHYVLYNSEYVMNKIKDKDAIRLENHVNTYITDYKNRGIFEREKDAIDYARTIDSTSEIQKRITTASNNVADKSYDIKWEIRMEEPVKGASGWATKIEQQSGKFYDLIPAGGEVDVSSIQVHNNERSLSEGEYTYELIPNYNNSGRTMLVISINTPGTQYLVYYKTVHSWSNVKDFGSHVLNPVAYETGNEKISDGYPDDGGNLSKENKAIYVDLDKTTDDKKFIYTQSTYDINAITATTSGLYKKVKNSKETIYSYDTITEPDGLYSYQWRYENTLVNKSKNLIFYDSLENFKIINSEAGTVKTSSWRGTVQSIDVSQIRSKGINPIVYISTKEDLDLEQYNDLTDTSVWKVVTPITDLSQAKAIAIDMRKDNNGNEYVLDAGDSLSATIYMRAPESIPEEHEYNPYTYNNIYIKNELIDELDQTKKYFIHQDYTRVKYHIVADVPGLKINARNNTEGVSGITFRLYGTSIYGTQIDEYATSGPQGNILFKDIEVGEYILQEYEATPDWLADYTEHRVRITRDRKVYVDDNLVTKANPAIFENNPRIHAAVKFNKLSTDHNMKISGAKFKISGTSKYGNEILEFATSNYQGIVEFSNVEQGTYDMIEVKTADGYISNKEKYKVIVDENGNYKIQSAGNQENTSLTFYNGEYTIYNEPYYKITFQKKDEYSEEIIEGAKFKLYGTSDYGNSYNQEAISTSMGFVNFDGIEVGTYLLEEVEPGKTTDAQGNEITYVLDTNKYIVTVERNGNYTIEGIQKDQYGSYVLYNKRNKGQITITKEWLDDSNNDERTEPEIHISSKKPEKELTKVYFYGGIEYDEPWTYAGYNLYSPLRELGEDYASRITGIFERNVSLTEEQVKEKEGVIRIDTAKGVEDAEYKMYVWIENGNCYWWSNADIAVMLDSDAIWSVTYGTHMFYKLTNITKIDLSYIDTSEVEDASWMFYGCSNLETIYASKAINNGRFLFGNCTSLKGGNGTTYDSSHTDSIYACIDNPPEEPGYFTYKGQSIGSDNNTGNDDSEETLSYSTTDKNLDDSGNEVHWVKDGNTWTYTFYVDDPNATWYVWEEPVPEGYTANYTIENPGIVNTQKATIRNYTPQKEALAKFGSLKISKKLFERSSEGERELTAADDYKEFTFKVTLTANSGNESLISGTKVFGDYVFKNGVATVKLHAGEEVTITDIPAGVSYNVTENEVNGYEVFAGSEGTITADSVSEVNAVNYKDSQTGELGESQDPTTSITIAKNVTGNSEVEEKYEIYVALDNLKPETTYNLSNGTTFTSDEEGSADVILSLGNNESVTIQNIPVGSKYKAYEVAGDYVSSYVIKDANNMKLISNTADSNSKSNTAISTKTETADDGEVVTITFTNKKIVTQNLKLQKIVTDQNDKNSYIFNVDFSNMPEGYSFNSTIGNITANSNGKISLMIYLAGGENVEFYGVPVGTKYKITELASASIASYTVTDKNNGTSIVSRSGANTIAKKALSTETETVNQGEEVTVTFTNDTVNQEPDSVSDRIDISKTVKKPDGTVINDCNEEFTFEIIANDESFPMPQNTEVKITGNGNASFGTITFNKTGTYTYKVIEKAGNNDIYTYDNTEYTIVYNVTNPEGLLEVSKSIKKNGFMADAITFTNILSKFEAVIFKTDEEESPVYGAKLQIIDSEGNVVKEWVTENKESNPIALKLACGEYTLHEVEAPKGYALADDVKFVVNKDGSVSVNGETVQVVIMKDLKDGSDSSDDGNLGEDRDKHDQTNDEKQEEPNEEKDISKEPIEEIDDKQDEPQNEVKDVKTGDNLPIYITIFTIAVLGLIVIIKKKN